ncbi:MAG: methylmalonyl-CoA mutase [Psychroserpens sp.]|nr:methylmalonyl-CoA mutase [Psychroserpens sp.]
MSESLFKQFSEVSAKEWKQKIQVDLKGADYNDTLIWHSNEGIDVKPFYHRDDFVTHDHTSDTKASQFKICQTFEGNDPKTANQNAKAAINNGVEALKFKVSNPNTSVEDLLNGIDVKRIKVYLETDFINSEFAKKLDDSIILTSDIIGNLAKSGNWYSNLKSDHEELEHIVKSTNTITVNAGLYQNAGATIVQQLAYSLAHVNEYLNHLEPISEDNQRSELTVVFNLAVGTNYFFEIAKIRALRVLWATLASEYGVNPICHIFVVPSKRNKTIYDYNTNMLRTTTECMSAILGGADTINNLAYDAIYHKPNEFGERISRNQLLVLKNESYFDKVDNPADGTYYIEALTDQVSEKALELFKDIESNGGFLGQLKEGTIQRKIKESAQREQEDFDSGKLVLLGTNKHPNSEDKMKVELEIQPFLTQDPRKTLIEPILEKRLSEQLDINRLKEE